MGCDIHMYIELGRMTERGVSWQNLGGRFNPGRDYDLFGRLAGVRRDGAPIVPLRGLPTDPAFVTKYDNEIYVVDAETAADGHCTRENAERWIKSGLSKYTNPNRSFVSNPDYHSHGWLTCDELEVALQPDSCAEYRAVIAAMRSLERDGFMTRVVFWFDN